MNKLSIILFFLFASCASGTGEQHTPATDTMHKDTVLSQPEIKDTSDAYTLIAPKELTPASFGEKKMIPGKKFSMALALQGLFPGHMYKIQHPIEEKDSMLLSAWTCKSCLQDSFSDWWGESECRFPYTDGNMTRAVDTLMFTDEDGKKNVIISFSSTQIQDPEMMFCGRFSCVILGLAVYTADNDHWALKSFAPQLGCYGAFQSLPKIHLIKLGKNNYGCYFYDSNGGAGGPFYTTLSVFGLVNNRFRLLLTKENVKRSRFNFSGWDMAINTQNTQADSFAQIQVVINGGFEKTSFEEEDNDTASLPQEIKATVKTNNHFGFKITRTYTFSDNTYKLTDSKSDIK